VNLSEHAGSNGNGGGQRPAGRMTRARREELAVARHKCPRCRAQAGFRCFSTLVKSLRPLARPHPERTALVSGEDS
jgi:hypothetical protein